MKKLYYLVLLLFWLTNLFAQEKDTLSSVQLKEILLIGKKATLEQKQFKALATLDEYLQQSGAVEMIKRGGYAWEPNINNMSSERTVITIDGMRIFGACTDKMDPITSYVEISNLSEAAISSGQSGSCHGPTIGGSIDLKRSKSEFGEKGINGYVHSGYEFNNQQKILGAALNYTDSLFFIDNNVMFRTAENYISGNKNEVLFSQFRKLNISNTIGYQFNKNKYIETAVIYDKATDVGYPALPMDVSLAEALITSLKFEYNPLDSFINKLETKVYYNTITHTMDDTKRPNVPIHMDMPGWSDTYGMYLNLNGKVKKNTFSATFNSFYNRSKAEMTMYPSDPNENIMFMLTWPDVVTFYNGIYLDNTYELNCHSSLKISGSLGNHFNEVKSTFGLESLRIFYPNMNAAKSRILKSFASNYNWKKERLAFNLGLAYGERAPSVSEGYGFYLFNSFDQFDYVGNPDLKNEQSIEGSFAIRYKSSKLKTSLSTSYFHISNYIIGTTAVTILPMTIGASGVKMYNALDYATLIKSVFDYEMYLTNDLKWINQIVYSYGKGSDNENLPFISPLAYTSKMQFKKRKFSSELGVQGNLMHTHYAPNYGEIKKPDYAILNFGSHYTFTFNSYRFNLKMGIENILDSEYTTFADWNTIPRMGRNVFANILFSF
ncbi:TonB-dependent receptor [Flavobacterium sp. 316]|uniref:TonB-dependent receptor domain-containing protein n=1 Tax=Flavobacterium sp. 316 TaxID=1603293 RepID=UPI0005DB7479|nr:TonB-dependent receptor [Flavobacterium sp. 316]KIX20323.1 TonB-dependent receptor [Flavobacterium sp. 316]